MTFRILSVCTGNICRSPQAELVLAQSLAGVSGIAVTSAGTNALVGAEIPAAAQALLRAKSIDGTHHRGEELTSSMIRQADLIVTMARDHRRKVAEMVPAAMRRTFTLRELARTVDEMQPRLDEAVKLSGASTAEDGMRAAIGLAASFKGTVAPPDDLVDLDIIDPYRRSDEIFALSFQQLLPAAESVADYLKRAGTIASAQQ